MLDCCLRQVVRLVPRRGPKMKLADRLWFPPHQLRMEELPEEVVVPVPLAVAINRDDEQVSLFEPLEDSARACRPIVRVTQRTAHPVENRGPRQKQHVGPRYPVQEFRAQVLRDEAVGPAEAGRRRKVRAAGVHRQRRQIEASGPALSLPPRGARHRHPRGAHRHRPAVRSLAWHPSRDRLGRPRRCLAASGGANGHRHRPTRADRQLQARRKPE